MRRKLKDLIQHMEEEGRLGEERKYLQHGSTTVYDHSVHVARASIRLAELLRIQVDGPSLLRGALLHDYFLYDWHYPHHGHGLHGFTHPKTALKNASRDFNLTEIEKNIIARHMFPLTVVPPTCREAWIVCLADKYCALQETIFRS